MGFAAIVLIAAVLTAQPASSPAQYRAGTAPALPALAVGGGEVFVELAVDATGRVTAVKPLRTTPPFTDQVVAAVRDWRFRPAESAGTPIASTVIVAAVFRSPALQGPTLGETPRNVGSATPGAPVPVAVTAPTYPATARESGVVVLEVRLDSAGQIVGSSVVRSAPAFDAAAQSAVRQWRFRPASSNGAPVPAIVYAVLGFPAPIVIKPKG
jgi:TonB family protein